MKTTYHFKNFLFALGYGLFFFVIIIISYKLGLINVLPNNTNLEQWDANWYVSIADKGYEYFDTASNSAFYMLFPLILRWSHLENTGVAFMNLVFMSSGFAIFASLYKMRWQEKLLLLSIPSLIIILVPYSEALFILLTCITFLGIAKDSRLIIWPSLFLLSLVRPVSMILIPAFIIVELLSNESVSWFSSIKNALYTYCLPLLAGQFFFIYYQYIETGVWFAFFKQEKNWGHEFSWPTLPFGSMNGLRYLWLNALALFCGVITLGQLILIGIKWLFNKVVCQDKLLLLSYLYITALALVTVFFSPTWEINSTNVYGAHRYIMATPFFWIFLNHFVFNKNYNKINYWMLLLISSGFWLLFASYTDKQQLLYFTALSFLIFLYQLRSNKKFAFVLWGLIAFNILVQVSIFTSFLQAMQFE